MTAGNGRQASRWRKRARYIAREATYGGVCSVVDPKET